MYSIGEIIASNRKKKKLSQAELAELLGKEGFHQGYKAISKWERNDAEPSVTVFLTLCRILEVTDIYGAYFGSNPASPLSTLNREGQATALDYIALLHAAGSFENTVTEIIPFRRQIDIYDTVVSAGTGNILSDSSKHTITVSDPAILPENASFGVRISGDSMEPEYSNGQIAWVLQKEEVDEDEVGIFSLNGEAYIKKLQEIGDGLYLVSLNTKYAPIPVGESDRLDIFGVVIGKSNIEDIPDFRG